MDLAPQDDGSGSEDGPRSQHLNFQERTALRAAVWQTNYKLFRQGHLDENEEGNIQFFQTSNAQFPAHKFYHSLESHKCTRQKISGKPPLSVTVVRGDCLDTAQTLQQLGFGIPLVMVAGSRHHFGGGYLHGARGQEEELCRRSTLALHCDRRIAPHAQGLYPYDHKQGVYASDVLVFRGGLDTHYKILLHPWTAAIGIISAENRPHLITDCQGNKRIRDPTNTLTMLRQFFMMAMMNQHKAVVAIPLGCGAFLNPPQHMAELFAQVINEVKSHPKCLIERVVIAAMDDRTSNKNCEEGVFSVFSSVLARLVGANSISKVEDLLHQGTRPQLDSLHMQNKD